MLARIDLSATSQSTIHNYCCLATTAVLFYEYFLTFDDETRFFWGRKTSSVKVLFLANRYFPLVASILVIVHNFSSLPQKECNSLHTVNQVALVVIQISSGGILAIRTYALYERARYIFVLLATICICAISIGVWSFTGQAPGDPQTEIATMFGCRSSLTQDAALHIAAPWITLLLYDTIIFSLTLFKAIKAWGNGSGWFFRVFIRDGSIYYLIIMMVNLLNIFTLIFAPPILKDVGTSFINVMSVMMLSRLMVNIQIPRSAVMMSEGMLSSAFTYDYEASMFYSDPEASTSTACPTWEGQP